MKNMGKRGFTLIELIVVIAIIGVLAAILVPTMMGYIAKSKIMSSNSAARDIASAAVVAMIEMDATEHKVALLQNDCLTATGAEIKACEGLDPNTVPPSTTDVAKLQSLFYSKVYQCFSDAHKLENVSFRLTNETCIGVGVMLKSHPGTYPIAVSADIYKDYEGTWDSAAALGYAVQDPDLYEDADPEQEQTS